MMTSIVWMTDFGDKNVADICRMNSEKNASLAKNLWNHKYCESQEYLSECGLSHSLWLWFSRVNQFSARLLNNQNHLMGGFWNIFTREITLRTFWKKTYSSDIGGIFIDSFDSLLSVHVDGPLHPFSNFLLSYFHLKND